MRALVTGAARGLGAAIADRVEADGGAVVRVDVEALPGVHVADVSDEAQVGAAVDAAVAQLGGLDLLVSCAGIGGPSTPVVDTDVAAFRRVLDVNLTGAFLMARAAGRVMIAAGAGSIVNVGSLFGQQGVPFGAAYCASKGGLALLTHSLSAELAPHGIRVNTVAPGYMDTDMHRDELRMRADLAGRTLDEELGIAAAQVPLGRHGTGADLAGVVVWLGSADAAYVTGQTIAVNGGLLGS